MEPLNPLKLGRLKAPAEVADQRTARARLGLPTDDIAVDPGDLVAVQVRDPSPPNWSDTRRWRLGVRAIDPVAHQIGPNIAKRRFVGLNWYPVDRFKHVLVGRLVQYAFYNPTGSGDEADWNIFIRPNSAFEFIRDDTLVNADLDQVHRDSDGAILVEAEVTPDEHFYDNPYFNENGLSSLVGRDIGVYGPWVMEEAHGWRPEIHPCQLLWWQDEDNGFSTYHLMIVQDDSNRFDKRSQFSGRIARPWAAPPVSGEFGLAVRIPQNQGRRYVIEQVFGRHVQPSAPAGGPRTIRRPVGATSEVEIEKALNNLRNVDVSIDQFVTASAAGEERGFIVLRTQVGVDSGGKEGYQVLRITESAL